MVPETGKDGCFPFIFYCIFVLRMLSPVEGNCSENGVALAGSSGSLTSPNYPNNYPSDTTCRWIITVPEGHQVKLNFQAFDLETCFISSTCTCDRVEIRDGSDKSSYELAEFCGGRTPGVASILSSGRVMWIEFKSDRLTRHKGFNATYTAVASPGECKEDGLNITGKSGFFTSPNYPYDYPSTTICRWIITVPEGHRVKLTFETFVMERCLFSSTCSCDRVEVRDGSDANSPLEGKFCGNDDNKPSGTITSTGRYLWIEFKSDKRFNKKGFAANYIADSTSLLSSSAATVLLAAATVVQVFFIRHNQ